MLRTTVLIISFISIFAGLAGCSTASQQNDTSNLKRVYFYPFENVWRAAQMSVARYPIQVNNADTGALETEPIKGDLAWVAPHKTKSSTLGRKYKISLHVFRGKSEGRDGVLVTINKKTELMRDFLSSENVPSDGLEEATILYRIDRELVIERAIKKSLDNKNQELDLPD